MQCHAQHRELRSRQRIMLRLENVPKIADNEDATKVVRSPLIAPT